MRFTKSSVLLSVFALLLAGCSSSPVVNADASSSKSEAPAQPAVTAQPQVAAKQVPPHLDPNSAISTKRSIYFDFDNFSIKKEYESVLELHGKYLASNPSLSIKVEGNADERGGTEYNLALGQKRAETVARALKVYGVKAEQVEATSWGEEKPKASGHDEASWAANRRADLVYPSK